MLAPGYVIGGRYRLVRRLGEGGMGVVWAAVNDAFGREVAIKLMRPGVASDPTAVERFFTEARICGTIRDPGIVDVIDVGHAEDGVPFLVMELLDGDSLDIVLHRARVLRPLDVLPIVRDVARTLALAHHKGVIHRDVKPGNVFLHRLPSGEIVAKVLDFGISKVSSGVAPSTRTSTGTVVGSPAYMSPEHAGGRLELDGRSDVYALGVILYEALSGRLPFQEQNYNALMIEIAVRSPPALSALAPGLPRPVLDLVKAAMAHAREARIPSADALADRVEATLVALGAPAAHPLPDPASLGVGAAAKSSPALSTSVARGSRRPSLWLAVAAAAGVLALGGIVGRTELVTPVARAVVAAPGPAAPDAPVAPPRAIPELAPSSTATPPAPSATPVVTPATSATSAPAVRPRKAHGDPGQKKGVGVWGYD